MARVVLKRHPMTLYMRRWRSRFRDIIYSALLVIGLCWRLEAQTVTIDTSPAGRRQVIDGFGTCLSGAEATQTTWWTNLYYGDLQASMLRMDHSL